MVNGCSCAVAWPFPFVVTRAELLTTYNQKSLATKGYMQSPNDWKNVEMTGYIKVNSFQQDDDTAWYNRGGRHTSTEPCEGTGTGYKGMYILVAKQDFQKSSGIMVRIAFHQQLLQLHL
jgi:hypothetical protein